MAVHGQQSPARLDAALHSLGRQTVPATEIVLVADGPLPAALQQIIALACQELPIEVVALGENRGLGAALDAGLAACTCPLVARMDSDDIALDHRFETQLSQLEETGADICGSAIIVVQDDGAIAPTRWMPLTHDDIVRALWANPFAHGSVMFRRDRVLQAGGYNPDLRRQQDYDLWFRCAEAGLRFANIAEPLLVYRDHSSSAPLPVRLRQAWRQARLGASNAGHLRLPLWKQAACYYPLLRALLPLTLRRFLRRLEGRLDPRRHRQPS